MHLDFRELLSALNDCKVKYLVVGDYAVGVHAQPCATKDFDLCRLRRAWPVFRMGREPVGVDIITAIPGVEFDGAWDRRLEDVVDEATNLRASFISRNDSIAAKLNKSITGNRSLPVTARKKSVRRAIANSSEPARP
jgi:hypothetical protein